MLKNSVTTYGSVAKFLHWLMAVLVLLMLLVGYFMNSAPIYNLHKLTGLVILILVSVRVIWVVVNPRPKLPPTVNKFERILSRSVQGLLYVCLFVMPLAGWGMSTASGHFPHLGAWVIAMPGIPLDSGLAGFFANVHGTTAVILMVLIGLHVLGALKHHFIDKDTVLKSMLPSWLGGESY